MICPRCSVAEISAETNQCVLCGYSPTGGEAVGLQVQPREQFYEHVRQELEQQFRIERLLRHGRRSLVYVAREVETERKVALKVIARQPVREAGMEDRFTRDAATAASLDHPHIVPIYRFGATAHLLWYSMKYVESRSLADILSESGPMELHACFRLVEQIASALQYAHRRGVTHGDVRPANILVDAQEWALVTDFAIGRLLERIPVVAGEEALTREPEYVAPEEAYARQPGPGADQYALAVLVYECLAGAPPAQPPQPLVAVRPEIPVSLSDALRRAMNPQPTARFMNVLEFVSVLGTGEPGGGLLPAPRTSPRPSADRLVLFVEGPARPRRWIGMSAGGVLALAALVGVLLVLRAPEPAPPALIELPGTIAVPPVDSQAVPAPTPPPRQQPRQEPRPPALAQRPAPARPAPAAGRLFVNATPWGQLYIDGQLVGNTPQANLEIPAGTHRIRIVRDGFWPFDLEIQVAPGQEVRLTDIVLQQVTP
ncbi:MAG: serine/threonine protein kinase [Gemmatimonadetes bacterium]|nr:serine/threonine protein kinase [Gemmatimonadota bacterium]